jgi:hypothetical protein
LLVKGSHFLVIVAHYYAYEPVSCNPNLVQRYCFS